MTTTSITTHLITNNGATSPTIIYVNSGVLPVIEEEMFLQTESTKISLGESSTDAIVYFRIVDEGCGSDSVDSITSNLVKDCVSVVVEELGNDPDENGTAIKLAV